MNRWKSVALIAISFNVGVLYATACGDAGKAIASDDSASDDSGTVDDVVVPPAPSEAYGRTALYMIYGPEGEDCVADGPLLSGNCSCPDGFSSVGIGKPGESSAMICLQD